MNAITMNTAPVQFGRDGHHPARVRRAAAAVTLLGLTGLGVAASTAPALAADPAPSGQGQFAVSQDGKSFSAEVPDTKGVTPLKPGPFECEVTPVSNLKKTEVNCADGSATVSNAKSSGLKEGFFGGLALAILAAIGLKAGGKKVKSFK